MKSKALPVESKTDQALLPVSHGPRLLNRSLSEHSLFTVEGGMPQSCVLVGDDEEMVHGIIEEQLPSAGYCELIMAVKSALERERKTTT